MSITIAEIATIAIILLCIICGAAKGFFKQFLSLVEVGGCFAGWILGLPYIVPILDNKIPQLSAAINGAVGSIEGLPFQIPPIGIFAWYIIGFFLVYFICIGLVALLGALGKKITKPKFMRKLDKLLGLMWAVAIFYVIEAICYAALANVPQIVSAVGAQVDLTKVQGIIDQQLGGPIFSAIFAKNPIGDMVMQLVMGMISK